MRSAFTAAFAVSALFTASGAVAQDEGAAPEGDVLEMTPDAPRGILGMELPENQERHQALLLQNFLSMDLNGDLLLAESEWNVWSGWRDLPPPAFNSVDKNGSLYIVYGEYEEVALASGDGRMGEAMHGAALPGDDAAE